MEEKAVNLTFLMFKMWVYFVFKKLGLITFVLIFHKSFKNNRRILTWIQIRKGYISDMITDLDLYDLANQIRIPPPTPPKNKFRIRNIAQV
jgi:hypothetical protein